MAIYNFTSSGINGGLFGGLNETKKGHNLFFAHITNGKIVNPQPIK
jgi:hypothetical protein